MKKETLGVDTIENEERNASPNTLVTVFLGANLSLSVMVFGWLSILYGLGWWESVSAILVGTFLGAVFVASSSLLGWSGATNNSVASGAFFGVRGRLIASFVGLLLCMQYVALTIWTGGEAFAAGISRITNTESTNLELSIGYALIAVIVVVFAVFGYHWLLRVNQFVAPAMGVLIILSVIALWDKFDPAYAGTPDAYALGSFWPTWFLAVLTCGAAGPISYVTQTGDWSRYISEQASKRDVVLKTFYALTLGLSVPTLFGAFVAVAAFDEDSFVGGYVANSPEWLLVPLLLIAVIGSLGQGGINLYSMGLDLDAILPKLKRNQSTAVVALISTLLVFLGKFVYDAESAVTNSVLFLSVLATSWLSITLYMFAKAKGVLSKDSLQVFNAGQTGGQYWFRNGWNLKAVGAWITGSAVGILGISSVDYVGPIAEFLNGIDVSIPAAGISSILILSLFKAKGR